LAPLGDYAVINVSSPNTPGLRELQQETQLRRLVERLRRLPGCPPLLVKIAPDLEDDAIDAIARLAYQEGLAGVIAVNTSQDRLGLADRILGATGRPLAQESGGLSGRPLRHRALAVLRRLRAMAGPSVPLIGVGATQVVPLVDLGDRVAQVDAIGRWLQLGAFSGLESAGAARERLATALGWPVDRLEVLNQGVWFKVQAGPFGVGQGLADAIERVADLTGSRPFVVVR
jgi:hypothetical protein